MREYKKFGEITSCCEKHFGGIMQIFSIRVVYTVAKAQCEICVFYKISFFSKLNNKKILFY